VLISQDLMPRPAGIPVQTIDREVATLGVFDTKALQVVNVPSKGGFARQRGPEGVKDDFPFRFSKSMVCCLLSIRRDRRSVKFHEAGMVYLTVAAQKAAAQRGAQAEDNGVAGRVRAGEWGGEQKNRPRGPRKSLKRLDSDKEIKVNSGENPRVFQAIPTMFQGFPRKEGKIRNKNIASRLSLRLAPRNASPQRMEPRLLRKSRPAIHARLASGRARGLLGNQEQR
jgi:hypothetical protein